MTPERQRIAIAEFCGWKQLEHHSSPWNWERPDGGITREYALPNFPNDLNAMHEAEKAFLAGSLMNYRSWLLKIVQRDEPSKNFPESCYRWLCVHATAAQRAEALLKTIGKWEDE